MPTYTTSAFSVGDVNQISITVTHPTSGVSTGSDCRYLVKTPTGTVTAYTTGGAGFASSTAGVYTMNITTTEAGDYIWRFESTGTVTSSTSGRFSVRQITVST